MIRAATCWLGVAWLAAACAMPDPSSTTPPVEDRTGESPSDQVDSAARAAWFVEQALEGSAYETLKSLVTAAPHRLSGSQGAADAVACSLNHMRDMGLQNVRAHKVTVPHWVRGAPESLELLVDDQPPVALPVLALGSSVATPPGGVTAEVVMVRSFEQLAEMGDAAKGKIVFFNRPMPRILANTFSAYGQAVPQRTSGAAKAGDVGAVAAIVRSMTTRIDDFPHTGAMRYGNTSHQIPAAAVSTRGAEQIAEAIRAGRQVRLRLAMQCETLPDTVSANVIGEIPGTDPDAGIVLIGGHLDSWDVGHGAHDDGAGCAHCLEAARLILASGHRPRRTIRVVLFMNEENGLRGAIGYAADHTGHFAAIETDAGGSNPLGFRTSARDERRARVDELMAPLKPFGMGTVIPGGGGADINQIQEPHTLLFGMLVNSQRYFDFHHSANDVLSHVHERELAMGAAALAHLALCLADEPDAEHER